MDIRALIMHLRAGISGRKIEEELGINRRTVKKYKAWAEERGLMSGALPPLDELQAMLGESMPEPAVPQNISSVEPYREVVKKLVEAGVEMKAIHQRLKERGFTGSYMAVYRFVRQMKGRRVKGTVRVELEPGEEGQVDFGYAGLMMDPETGAMRRSWAFVMTLSYSRHQYVEFVFNQKVETWLNCHRHAFEYFGGVPERVVIDNLKAAITKATRDDPAVQIGYQECALHYGFLISPCRVRTPQHKGKVEQGGVHYVKRNFLGGREPTSLSRANQEVLVWCGTIAGLRWHGTTKKQPLKHFEEAEKSLLRPLPPTPYDQAVWKQLTLNRDCYVEFERSYYSAPHRLLGQKLWVCGNLSQVRIFDKDYQLVATHPRADQPGNRYTHPDHLPPELLPGLTLDREVCRQQAQAIGPSTLQIVSCYLQNPVLDYLPTVGRLLRLQERFGPHRLEAACTRAITFDDPYYKTVKRILQDNLDRQLLPDLPASPPASIFVRSPRDLLGPELGETRWN